MAATESLATQFDSAKPDCMKDRPFLSWEWYDQ